MQSANIERITISEAARRFNCSAVWLRRLCQHNRIASWKVTERLYLVDPNDVAAWFANAPQPGRPKKQKQKPHSGKEKKMGTYTFKLDNGFYASPQEHTITILQDLRAAKTKPYQPDYKISWHNLDGSFADGYLTESELEQIKAGYWKSER